MHGSALGVTMGGAALALLFLFFSLRLRGRQRLLRDLPTSKARGVFVGLVEVKGTAECAHPLTSFLNAMACVHYTFKVEEQWSRTVTESYKDDAGRSQTRTREESGWTTVAQGGLTADFFIRDDTGVVLVRPKGAKIEAQAVSDQTVSPGHPLYYGKGPAGAVSDSESRRRFVEHIIPLHAALFIVGEARERADQVAPEIAASRDASLFLISTRTEEKVASGRASGSWAWWLLGLVTLIVALFLATQLMTDVGVLSPPFRPVSLAGAAAYLMAWAAGWVWMVFNSLVGLRHRVRRGWSLIEVELKRRHDLLPNLIAMVNALAGHERETATVVAAMRTQLAATAPGERGPDFDGVAGQLHVVMERFPSLSAQPAFAQLHARLVETEQRIALARTYYNDIATHFATRLAQVPDRFVALLGAMRPEPLLTAAHFERAVVQVDFAP